MKAGARYIFRLDDIAPNMDWEHYEVLRALFDQYEVKPLIGVIPDNQDPTLLRYPACPFDFWRHVAQQQERGWEIALHGYQHAYTRRDAGLLGINRRSEFAGYPYDIQFQKIREGLDILSGHGLHPCGFMAPAHSFDGTTLAVLRKLGLTRITDGFAFYPYRTNGILFVPQLFANPRPMGFGVLTFCLHPNEMTEEQLQWVATFLRHHRERVIRFTEAEAYLGSAFWQRPVGAILQTALTLKRLSAMRRRSSGTLRT